jgi:TatD DNase family protein
LIANGFHISFGKYLLQKKELKEVFIKIPNDRIFLETDTIEEGIETVYQLAANYKEITVLKIQEIINSNFAEVFNKQLNRNH